MGKGVARQGAIMRRGRERHVAICSRQKLSQSCVYASDGKAIGKLDNDPRPSQGNSTRIRVERWCCSQILCPTSSHHEFFGTYFPSFVGQVPSCPGRSYASHSSAVLEAAEHAP